MNGIQGGGGLGRAAIEAALKRQSAAMDRMRERMQDVAGEPAADSAGFGERMDAVRGLEKLDGEVKRADELAEKLITGEVDSFHEVAAQLKQTDLSFKFALQVRNKLVDAYREVMRMSV